MARNIETARQLPNANPPSAIDSEHVIATPLQQTLPEQQGHGFIQTQARPAQVSLLRRSDAVDGSLMMPLVRANRPFQFASISRLDEEVVRATRYGHDVEGLRDTTIQWWRASYAQFRRFLNETDNGAVLLRGEPDAQARILEQWIAWLRGRGALHGTIRSYWCAMVSLVDRFAKLDGIWNPFRMFPRPRAAPPIPRALQRDDAERLLTYLEHAPGPPFLVARNLAIVGCMVFAGLRRGEVLRLDRKHVNRGARTIRIHRGKGRNGGKTRMAYMPKQLATLLRLYEESRDARGYTMRDAYFVSLRAGIRLNEGSIRRLFTTIRRQTGLDVSPHVLRHTFVTLMRQSGADDRVTMELAGHTSLVMTQRYSAVFSGEHLAAADRLELDF
jgi:integrase